MVWLRPLAIVMVAILGMALMLPAGSALAHEGGPVALQKAKGDKCVKPMEEMRRTHMDFLKHKRETVVREGVRVKDDSLLNCVSCHTSRTQFCDKCHSYVGVKPDCFECHNYPK